MPTFESRQDAINRKRTIAQALLQQGMSPIAMPQVAGAKVSPLEGIAKLVQALSGNIGGRQADKQQSALSDEMLADKSQKNQALIASLMRGGDPAQTQSIADALGGDKAQQEVAMSALQEAMIGQRPAPPRNIDPLSPEGITAQNAVSQGAYHAPIAPPPPRNIDPLSTEGIAAQTQLAGIKPPPNTPQPTSAIQEYQFYVEQETKGGRKPLSFDEWQNRDANRKAVNPNAATVVIQTVDDNGNKVTKIVPKVAGSTFSGAPTAQEQNRRDQADIVERQVDHVMELIDKAPNAVGPILGRLARGETVVGTVAPEAKALATALGSLEALQPILHGYRGGSQTMDHFHSIIGDQSLNAAALKASLKEIKALAADIRKGDSTPPPAGNIDNVLDKLFGPAPKK